MATATATLANHGVRLGGLAAGARHLLGYGQPRDVANAAAFLISNAARWITGTTLVIDGGYTLW